MKKKTSPNTSLSDEFAEKMKQWRKNNPKATLTEIEEAVDSELAQMRQTIVERLVQEELVPEQTAYECPQCGKFMVKNGKRKRKLKTKGGEQITFEREQMRCLECGMTIFPPG
jgi:predicted RNA-binding Zn-ribbon protein involved in translation (DUF1610 family)